MAKKIKAKAFIAFNKFESSNIKEFSYNPSDRELQVEFYKGGVYSYEDVPFETLQQVLGSDSIAKAFNSLIRDNYKSTKL